MGRVPGPCRCPRSSRSGPVVPWTGRRAESTRVGWYVNGRGKTQAQSCSGKRQTLTIMVVSCTALLPTPVLQTGRPRPGKSKKWAHSRSPDGGQSLAQPPSASPAHISALSLHRQLPTLEMVGDASQKILSILARS